eukprot:TRINITY_DN40752_c0_g1_i1.p1 TRINITY_DN40752_c0_g1~~TRINITY_DN40752_c0_g1_i1.p1  ORF type:complete len:1072 (+),score=129.96 TRINITY_DN40752_c0_g1_i1:345-3218(+)
MAPVLFPHSQFRQLGCHALAEDDDGGRGGGSADVYFDYSCLRNASLHGGSMLAVCRSGLPFYNMVQAGNAVMSWRMCAKFCLNKGLDVSGVVDARRCRCGASEANSQLWSSMGVNQDNSSDRRDRPSVSVTAAWKLAARRRAELTWGSGGSVAGAVAVAPDDERCRILVARYSGPLPFPRRELDLSDDDLTYLQSILLGVRIGQLADAGQPALGAPVTVDLASWSGGMDGVAAVTNEELTGGKGGAGGGRQSLRDAKGTPRLGVGPGAAVESVVKSSAAFVRPLATAILHRVNATRATPEVEQGPLRRSRTGHTRMNVSIAVAAWHRNVSVGAISSSNNPATKGEEEIVLLQFRPCFPRQCAAGLPWPIMSTYLSGIPFAFSSNVAEETRVAFREAATAYSAATCIRFTEVSTRYEDEYKILVTSDDDGCWTSPMGYPVLYAQDTTLNLGWCDSDVQIGNMIHELGHALGMAHEHARPDRDRFVRVHQSQLSSSWIRQYTKNSAAFTGSQEDGFAPYDFGSLMHYPANLDMHTLPLARGGLGVHDSETGQRRGLSMLDVQQLREMYGCDRRNDVVARCEDDSGGLGSIIKVRGRPGQCSQLWRHCRHPQYGRHITYFCRRTCESCPRLPPLDTVTPTIEGCRDASPFCHRYVDFCPRRGRLSNVNWMAKNCRGTCNIKPFCGTESNENTTGQEAIGPGGFDGDSGRGPTEEPSPCIDSTNTGFRDALGGLAGCAALASSCRDPEQGGQIRRLCPASCGMCVPRGDGLQNHPLDKVEIVVTFVLDGAGYDLAVTEQKQHLEQVLWKAACQLWSLPATSLRLSVSAREACLSPCFMGSALVRASCCVLPVASCPRGCEDARRELLHLSPIEVREGLASFGLSGFNVLDIRLVSNTQERLSAFFARGGGAYTAMLCGGAAVLACFVYSLTVCYGSSHKRGRVPELEGELSSDESSDLEGC